MTSARDAVVTLQNFKGLNLKNSIYSSDPVVLERDLTPYDHLMVAKNVDIETTGIKKARAWTSEFETLVNAGDGKLLGPFKVGSSYRIIRATPTTVYEVNLLSGGSGTSVARSFALTNVEWGIQYFGNFYLLKHDGTIRKTDGTTTTSLAGTPSASHGAVHKDRLFVINNLDISGGANHNRVWFSDVADFATFGAGSFLDVSPRDEDFIVAVVSYNEYLVIFKSRSTWILEAEGSPENWVLRNVNSSMGASSKWAIKEYDELLYVANEKGFHAFDGVSYSTITPPGWGWSRDSYAYGILFSEGIFDPYSSGGSLEKGDVDNLHLVRLEGRKFLFTYYSSGGLQEFYVYNSETQQWSMHFLTEAIGYFMETRPPSTFGARPTLFASSLSGGQTLYYHAPLLPSQNPMEIAFGLFHSESPTTFKRLKETIIEYVSYGGNTSFKYLVEDADNEVTALATENLPFTTQFVTKRIPGYGYFRRIAFKLTIPIDAGDFILKSLTYILTSKRRVTT